MADEDGFTIDIEGLTDLQAKLTDLGDKKAQTAIRKALRVGASIERAAIIAHANTVIGQKPQVGGSIPPNALRNDIVIKMTRDEQGNNMAVIGPDKYTAHVARWL